MLQGTIVSQRLASGGYDCTANGKPVTKVKIDGDRGEFDLKGLIGKLGDKVEITARVLSQSDLDAQEGKALTEALSR